MNKKHMKLIVVLLQLFLIGSLFLPAGRMIESTDKGDSTLSVFGMIEHYAGMGFSDDARFYTIMACFFPSVIILSVLFLKDRKNFGIATILCALYLAASACFYSSAPQRMVDYATMTWLPYLILVVALASLVFLILGFFLAMPPTAPEDEGEKR